MFVTVEFGPGQTRLFNINVTKDILADSITANCTEDMMKYQKEESLRLHAEIKEAEARLYEIKKSASKNEGGETTEDQKALLATCQEKKDGLELRLKALEEGVSLFENIQKISLVDAAGNAVDMSFLPEERANEVLTAKGTYALHRVDEEDGAAPLSKSLIFSVEA